MGSGCETETCACVLYESDWSQDVEKCTLDLVLSYSTHTNTVRTMAVASKHDKPLRTFSYQTEQWVLLTLGTRSPLAAQRRHYGSDAKTARGKAVQHIMRTTGPHAPHGRRSAMPAAHTLCAVCVSWPSDVNFTRGFAAHHISRLHG